MTRSVLSKVFREALRHFRLYELVILADKLSENEERWKYKKNSIRNVVSAISMNVTDEELALALEGLWGVFVEEDRFPPVAQFGKSVFGPLGLFASSTRRSRTEAEDTIQLLEKYLSKNLITMVESLKGEIPQEVYARIYQKQDKSQFRAMQAIIAYATDEVICEKANELVKEGKIKIEIPYLFETPHAYADFVVTRYCFIKREAGEPVEKLRDLLLSRLNEEQLKPELSNYAGDYPTRVLEYCIEEDPLEILVNLFGLPVLRDIAGERRVNTGSSRNPREIATLILLKLGFNIPPKLEGLRAYVTHLRQYENEFAERSDRESRAAVMTRVYVEMERLLRDLTNFYVGFLWQDEVEEYDDVREGITQILKKKVLDPIKLKKPVNRLGFGDFIQILRRLNSVAERKNKLRSKVRGTFERKSILPKRIMTILDEVSPYRASFAHPKMYPGNGACRKIFKLAKEFEQILRSENIYPTVLRITREISDEYGRGYAKGIDESDNTWTIYTGEWLDPERQYLMYSKTNPIAVHPVLVQKI